MTNIEYRKSISEVLDILEHTNKEDVDKISPKFIEFLNKNKCDNYKPTLDHSKRIKEMNLRETTIGILSIINSKFWCTPKQKELFDDKLKQNEKIYQEKLREKYNPDNLFKNKNSNTSKDNFENENYNTALVEVKEKSLLQRIFDTIKNFFRK